MAVTVASPTWPPVAVAVGVNEGDGVRVVDGVVVAWAEAVAEGLGDMVAVAVTCGSGKVWLRNNSGKVLRVQQ